MLSKLAQRSTSFCALLFIIASLSLKAQKQPVQLANTEQFTLHSEAVNDDFEIMVGLPFGYAQSATRYKVLYVLDANVTFGLVSDIQTLMSFEPENPAMIIVGIGYKDFGNWIQKRARDYMPSAVSSAPGSGGADKFLQFLEVQLISHMDKEYRTNESRLIYGHSTAGLFGLYALFNKPDLFQGYIITSPSVDEDGGYALNQAKQSSPAPAKPVKVFTSYGSREKSGFQSAYKTYLKVLQQWEGQGIRIKSEVFDASHMSSMAPAFVKGLEFVNRKD